MIISALKRIRQTLIKWTNFPTVKPPPLTVASKQSIFSIHLNIALILILYFILGDPIIATISGCILFLAVCSEKPSYQKLKNSKLVLALLAASVIVFVWRFGGSTGGRSWTGLLTILISLKILESKNIRDFYVSTIMLYFFAAIVFAYNNSAIAPIALITFCILTTASLMSLSASSDTHKQKILATRKSLQFRKLMPSIKQSGKILLQALPIAIVLFFLFPRIQGNFGFLPNDPQEASSGLADTIEAGSFSDRAVSNELAFRVEFNGVNKKNIASENMYWRVKTFSKQLGFRWEKQRFIDIQNDQENTRIIEDEDAIDYIITHQPTSDKQLPSLETVVEAQTGKIINNRTIKTNSESTTTFQYSGRSTLYSDNLFSKPDKQPRESLSPYERGIYLETLYEPRNKTRKLLNTWLSEVGLSNEIDNPLPNSDQSKALALKALRYFRSEPFKYNLLPPNLDQSEAVEDFLFRTRSGYCEHYASTFSSLMRWMNIPTRVVAGFQGAEYNAQGDFYEVRYSSSHAWSEIWTQDNGWIRVDPTSAVAPERIEFGMEALLALLLQEDKSSFSGGDFSEQKLRDVLNPSGSFLTVASDWLSSANHKWDKWIVNYSFEQQAKLLKSLGLESTNQNVTLLIILSSILSIIFGFIIWMIWPRKIKRTPIDAAFYRFKQKLRKSNIPTPISEGPEDLRHRLLTLLPNNSADIDYICQYYVANKYQENDINIDEFINAIKRFKPINPKTV